MRENKVYFSKIKDEAIIPSKRKEDAGYDIYACFKDDILLIEPNETKLVPTGIASAFHYKYYFQIKERSSTGSLGLKVSAGVIDSGYRGEWFISLYNSTNKNIYISKQIKTDSIFTKESIIYPYNKAICQAVLLPVPVVDIEEIDLDELRSIKSERKLSCLGDSNK